ncbi:hypothetical protein C4D60_Mb10t16160 [Musa balbisiana]|uniref:DEX1 C-terminal domain-containing protein n=1 Tax=Musa balbisiana TaxID=52838 RepID=A0A4S8IXI6_MUSBA|nr:hypothetical protein C4D60_Mb10t16160 [Musa balbisiana]
MRLPAGVLILVLLIASPRSIAGYGVSPSNHTNKFRDREASDDMLGYPHLDEDSLLNTKCPKHLELRWQTEVSSSIYATPLIADINSDGKLEIVVPSFVHYLEVLEGSDGDKLPGWPAFHQSTVHSSPLLFDIDKDGTREIGLATYNGVINFFRVSGYMMMDKLEVPRRRVRKNWYVGLHPDPVDRSHPDVHDDLLVEEASAMNSMSLGNVTTDNTTHIQRRLLEETDGKDAQDGHSETITSAGATVENDQDLEEEADSSFDLFRNTEELADEYNYDYDDYVDESMWGDENWTEESHEKLEDYVSIDSHILCTPVIADIDNDGIQEMVVAVSYFFDREYYDNPQHLADLGGINIEKYVASGIVVFNLDTKQVKWTADLDLSVDSGNFRAYIYSSPTVVDLDGDGNMDILVGTSYGLFYILDHHGKVRNKFPLEMAEIQAPVVAADINDDGKIEIVTADTHGNVAAWTAQGEEIWEGPTVGDVDGDGHTDIVIPTVSGNIYVLSGQDGSHVRPFPFRTHGRVMNQILLVDLNKRNEKLKGLTLVTTSFDGYLYLIDGSTACADVVDIGETSYTMVLADNVDGGDDLDLVVTTMNGNVFCFSTPSPHHPLKEWRSPNQGRNNVAVRSNREGIYISHASRAFRDEEGKHFWGPTVGDVDGDGHTDIVIPTVSGNIYVLSGQDGSHVRPFPFRTHGRVMNQILLVDLNKRNEKLKGLTLVTTSFDGYLYLIDGSTACADVVDIGETSYTMVLADNVDGGDDLDLVVTTMNGNVFCFSTPSPHHPLKEWRSPNQGRNNVAVRSNREGIYISHASRAFRDEEGKHFWVEMEIVDKYRVPSGFQGPYNVTTTLLVPGNYQGERRIVVNQVYDRPGKQRIKLPTVPVRTTGTVVVEMVDKNGLHFSDEFSLTFHMHYYKLLKWLTVLPMLGMFAILVILGPQERAPLPSFSRNID